MTRRIAIVLALGLTCAAGARAQQIDFHSAPPEPPAGISCLPPELAQSILASIPSALRQRKDARGVLTTLYADPMQGGTNSFGRTIVNYVDLDPTTGLLDYNCGDVTYDGHTGVDIEISDFYEMDAGVAILCAAAGTVVTTHDGEFDRQTQWLPNVTPNYVVVQHADGTYAYYLHMRKGSVRVTLGQLVAVGDTLGLVGSSGRSSGAHLHFETYAGGVREPYSGPCQGLGSLWLAQGPYVWAYPREIFNHGITTISLDWPTICERPPSKTHFRKGQASYTWIRARNLQASDQVMFQYYSPLGLWGADTYTLGVSRSTTWISAVRVLPNSTNYYGNWHVDVRVNGTLVSSEAFKYDGIVNQPPTIAPRTVQLLVNANVDVDLAGQDPDGSVFWHDLIIGPTHGTVSLGNTRRHLLHYVPAPGFVGLDSVTVHAEDDELLPGPNSVIRFDVVSEATATLLSLESAEAGPNEVRLLWYTGSGGFEATLERSEAGGPWSAIATLAPDGTGQLRYVDPTVSADTRYGYRLSVASSGGERYLGEAWVTTPRVPELSLEGLRPNPATSSLIAAFSLARAGDATLTLLDVSGRRVAERQLAGLAAGAHVVNVGDALRLSPGLYVVRLTQGSRTVSRKAVVSR